MNAKSNSIAFILAEAGYDVWAGNSRGNRFSRRHTKLDPAGGSSDKQQFWDFSFQEMAEIDALAFLDKIKEETGVEKVTWVGHSQGATQVLYGLASPKL